MANYILLCYFFRSSLQEFLCFPLCATHFMGHLEVFCMVILWAPKLKGVSKPLSVNQGGKSNSSAHQFSVLSTSGHFFPLCFSLKTRHNLLGFPGVWARGTCGFSCFSMSAWSSDQKRSSRYAAVCGPHGSRKPPALRDLKQMHAETGNYFVAVVLYF